MKKRPAKRGPKLPVLYNDYASALETFDIAICEAIAVSQAQAGRLSEPHVGYASYIFARLCAHGSLLIRAAPRSRWVRSDSEDWNFSAVACHARALLEGYLFFAYMIEPPASEAEMKARINVMHLNDCTRRAELMESIGAEPEQLAKFAQQQEELRDRLRSNDYFRELPGPVQRTCLAGKKAWIKSREQLLEPLGIKKSYFDTLWILYSQHTHILPLSFYRMEPNGRGTGIENEADKDYMRAALAMGAEVLRSATDSMVKEFPDVAGRRCGLLSVFSPGPKENAPLSDAGDIAQLDESKQDQLFAAITAALSGAKVMNELDHPPMPPQS